MFWLTGTQLTHDRDDTGRLADHSPGVPWLGHRGLMFVYGAFLAYAAVSAVFAAGEDKVWAIWAVGGYAAALLIMWRWRSRGQTVALGVSVAVAVVAPERPAFEPPNNAPSQMVEPPFLL